VTYFINDGANELAELGSAGARLRFYVNANGMDNRIGMYDDGLGAWRIYHTNQQGSVLFTTAYATSGTILDQYHYGAYGEPATTDAATGNPFRYTGRYLDAETGLYYYRARYYSSKIGRFLQTDPIGTKDDLDLYAYTGNDPVNEADPTGRCTGSHIENGDGTCVSTGGNTTGLDGASQGVQFDRAVQAFSQALGRLVQSDIQVGGDTPAFVRTGMHDDLRGYNVNLLAHELAGGHTIALHVAKTLAYLLNRVNTDPDASTASSFFSLRQATSLINMTLNENRAGIATMLAMPGNSWAAIRATFDRATGRSVTEGTGGYTNVSSVFVLLTKPAVTPEGFLIWTAYPVP